MSLVATVILGIGAALGCGGNSANNAPPATASSVADDDAAGLTEHHRHHHHGGVTLFIAMSLDTLGVSPDQHAAVDKIRTDLHARMEPTRAAEQTLMTTLADGLAAGSIDTTKVDAAIAQLASAAAAVHEASADALNQLHEVLTPPQRGALVDKVEAHWSVWQKANADEAGQTTPEDGHVATLATELGLRADQVDKIRANLAEGIRAVPRLDPQEIAAHLRAFGDAFRSERFDARALATAKGADAHLVSWGSAYLAHFIEAAMPVLTAEQRTQLAQRLREHATHNPSIQGNP
jgi:Spy/CpxP family protein refolding chaperone